MNKSQIRKKILKIRKKNNFKKLKIDFKNLLYILKNENIKGKNIGGYYPYNYEVDVIEILKEFEKKKFLISLPKIKNNFQMDFFEWSLNSPLVINEYGIPEPVSNKIIYHSSSDSSSDEEEKPKLMTKKKATKKTQVVNNYYYYGNQKEESIKTKPEPKAKAEPKSEPVKKEKPKITFV